MSGLQLYIGFYFILLISGLYVIWRFWVIIEDDGFSPDRRPDFFRFYLLFLINVCRFLMLKETLSLKEVYPSYFPRSNKSSRNRADYVNRR